MLFIQQDIAKRKKMFAVPSCYPLGTQKVFLVRLISETEDDRKHQGPKPCALYRHNKPIM